MGDTVADAPILRITMGNGLEARDDSDNSLNSAWDLTVAGEVSSSASRFRSEDNMDIVVLD